jgi:hypothetical protein
MEGAVRLRRKTRRLDKKSYIPCNNFARTSGSGVTPKGLNLRSPSLGSCQRSIFTRCLLTHALVLANAPIHLQQIGKEQCEDMGAEGYEPRLAERVCDQSGAHHTPQSCSLDASVWMMIFGHGVNKATVGRTQQDTSIAGARINENNCSRWLVISPTMRHCEREFLRGEKRTGRNIQRVEYGY